MCAEVRKEWKYNMKNERLSRLKERLNQYYDAESKILKGQSYTIGSRQLTRANLADVQKTIKELEADVAIMERRGTTRRRSSRAIPLDC